MDGRIREAMEVPKTPLPHVCYSGEAQSDSRRVSEPHIWHAIATAVGTFGQTIPGDDLAQTNSEE